MDYKELAKALQETDFSDGCPCGAEPLCEGGDCIILQAANAIVELRKTIDALCEENTLLRSDLDAMRNIYIAEHDARIEEIKRHRWISVTEALPESGVHVLACCRVKWLGGGGRSYVCDAFYSAPKTEVCSYNDDIDAEYDEETDEYYMPEGWWEVIKNWDEYSCVAIADFVTHWMPLPTPEEEKR